MSIVVAAHNHTAIVIASDGLSVTTRTGSWQTDSTIEKFKQLSPRLAYMLTGRYASDKLQFMKKYATDIRPAVELDVAFWSLYKMAQQHMTTYPTEGFRLGLAGFNAGIPGFKCITVQHGHDIVAEGATVNYYVSGEREPVILSEERLKASRVPQKPPTDEITRIISGIVKECIDTYPTTLGDPVNTLVLSNL